MTHRCHNGQFLLKFARDRDTYREMVREHLRKYGIWLLDYCVTCNHAHLLVDAEERERVSMFMQEVASEFARQYNRRKSRMNAFWGDNFHATVVESGKYLWECLCYIELNMVRCGAVAHPKDWQWLGYHEITRLRRRYRLIDLERLCWRLTAESLEELGRNLEVALAERIAKDQLKREPCWTEGLAVGSREFVESMKPLILSRRETEVVASAEGWELRETLVSYGQKSGPKNASKGDF